LPGERISAEAEVTELASDGTVLLAASTLLGDHEHVTADVLLMHLGKAADERLDVMRSMKRLIDSRILEGKVLTGDATIQDVTVTGITAEGHRAVRDVKAHLGPS
jgi:hypothetical protein